MNVKEHCEQSGLKKGIALNADARCQQLESLFRKLAEACDFTLRVHYPDPQNDEGMKLSPLMKKLRVDLNNALSCARKAGIIP